MKEGTRDLMRKSKKINEQSVALKKNGGVRQESSLGE